ncbi:MAG: AAA domain-containing protein [Gemmatimonadetes bacterium]|nr:AAA domain-containing protein [Gemmatimonadota bacterium]
MEIVTLRNRTDELEQSAEAARASFGAERLKSLMDEVELDRVSATTARLAYRVDRATRARHSAFTRLLWPLFRGPRAKAVGRVAVESRGCLAALGAELPDTPPSDDGIEEWLRAVEDIQNRLAQLRAANAYMESLATLNAATPMEALEHDQHKLLEALIPASRRVWGAWLDTLPGSLTAPDKQALGALLALVKLRGNVGAKARELLPRVVKFLPCWALTNLSARRFPFAPAVFDIVVVDEASQCDIASALPLLFRAKRAVIIGDPKQLRHITQVGRQQDEKLLEKHDLLGDHLRWSYSVNSLYDLASSLSDPGDVVALRDHHRSHTDVIGFSNKHFYESKLRIATAYDKLKLINGGAAVTWRHVDGFVKKQGGKSALNEAEAREVVAELENLILNQGYPGIPGVVTPFRAQANRIRQLVTQRAQLSQVLDQRDLVVDTAHGFQGDERDLIVFSPVAAPGLSDSSLWFLKRNGYLFNVAITRAKGALRVIGHRQYADQSGVDYLAEFSDYVRRLEEARDGRGVDTDAPAGAEDLGPAYPSVRDPDSVSEWERIFYKALYQAGIQTIPQYPVEKYRLDLALFAGDRRLDIEVDGERYHSAWDGELLRRDQLRNARMIELGWDVMRFWVYQIRDSMDESIARVQRWLA